MSTLQIVITILILAACVWVTRFLPFAVFKRAEKLPKIIDYLGRVLPGAMMGLLVVYCFKDYDFSCAGEILPALIAAALTVGIHLLKHNTILSIALGTAAYMVLIRVM